MYWVLQGKTEDAIYLEEKLKLRNTANLSTKLTGYIAPEEHEQLRTLPRSFSQQTVYSAEKSLDTTNMFRAQSTDLLNQSSQGSCCTNQSASNLGYGNLDMLCSQSSNANSNVSNNNHNNSSSKSNSKNSVLRENFDSDQRQKSANKFLCFSGKDQKNVSPFNDKVRNTSNSKPKVSVGVNANILKAKRQISFDA